MIIQEMIYENFIQYDYSTFKFSIDDYNDFVKNKQALIPFWVFIVLLSGKYFIPTITLVGFVHFFCKDLKIKDIIDSKIKTFFIVVLLILISSIGLLVISIKQAIIFASGSFVMTLLAYPLLIKFNNDNYKADQAAYNFNVSKQEAPQGKHYEKIQLGIYNGNLLLVSLMDKFIHDNKIIYQVIMNICFMFLPSIGLGMLVLWFYSRQRNNDVGNWSIIAVNKNRNRFMLHQVLILFMIVILSNCKVNLSKMSSFFYIFIFLSTFYKSYIKSLDVDALKIKKNNNYLMIGFFLAALVLIFMIPFGNLNFAFWILCSLGAFVAQLYIKDENIKDIVFIVMIIFMGLFSLTVFGAEKMVEDDAFYNSVSDITSGKVSLWDPIANTGSAIMKFFSSAKNAVHYGAKENILFQMFDAIINYTGMMFSLITGLFTGVFEVLNGISKVVGFTPYFGVFAKILVILFIGNFIVSSITEFLLGKKYGVLNIIHNVGIGFINIVVFGSKTVLDKILSFGDIPKSYKKGIRKNLVDSYQKVVNKETQTILLMLLALFGASIFVVSHIA